MAVMIFTIAVMIFCYGGYDTLTDGYDLYCGGYDPCIELICYHRNECKSYHYNGISYVCNIIDISVSSNSISHVCIVTIEDLSTLNNAE